LEIGTLAFQVIEKKSTATANYSYNKKI